LGHFENRLGTVYCTSGTGSSGGWILDWGLAKLAAGRFLCLTRINEPTYDKHLYDEVASCFPSWYPGTQRGDVVTPDEVKRADNRTVFKCGRTTGSTQGELNTVDSSVRMRYDFDGGYEIVEGKALLVVSPPGSSTLWPSANGVPIAFGWRGDSGSLVFDHQGRVLGMYFGGQDQSLDYQVDPPVRAPSIDGIHFISPIHLTLDAIRAAASKDPAFQGQDVKVDFVWGPI
jgi:hypothetical protein